MLEALVLTILIEGITLVFLKVRDYKIYMISILLNICTNLSLNAFLLHYEFKQMWLYVITVIVLEVIIVFIETWGYWLYLKQYKKALSYASILNITSFSIGIIINCIFHYDIVIEILRVLFPF